MTLHVADVLGIYTPIRLFRCLFGAVVFPCSCEINLANAFNGLMAKHLTQLMVISCVSLHTLIKLHLPIKPNLRKWTIQTDRPGCQKPVCI